MKRLLHLGLTLAVGLAAGYVVAYTDINKRVDSVPGTEYMSVPEEEVRFFSYASDAMTLTAQRPRSGAPFVAQATFTDERPAQRCNVSADLAGQLYAFSHLILKRSLSLDERGEEFPVFLGVLDIRDQVSPEFFGPMLVFTNKQRTSVAVIFQWNAAELTIPLAAFKKLEAGCAGLVRN